MTKWLVALAGAFVMIMVLGSVARADGGPHGGYTSTGGAGGGLPDQCAACHRVHQGQSTGKLLKADSPYALCLTCHNGAGSKLDVLDGVKLAANITPDSTVIRFAETTDISISIAPDANLSAGAGSATVFTIAVRNRTAGAASVTLAITAETNIDTAAPGDDANTFLAAALGTTSLSVPAASGGVPGVAYTTLTTTSEAGAAAANQTLTTITATFNSLTATVRAQTRVGSETGGQYATAALNGGGFRYIAGTAVTSRHNADPADNSLYPWGYNSNTGQNTNALTSPLQCTSCHNPHGTANYRLLKESVNGNAVVVRAYYSAAFTKDEGARGLETGAPTDKYTREYYGSAGSGGAPVTAGQGSVSSLCAACHTAYPSTGASTGYTAGGVTHYRHKTEMPYTDWTNPDTGAAPSANPESAPITGFPALRLASNATQTNTIVSCLTCHRVHGSTSSMAGYALKTSLGGSGDADLTPSQLSGSTSTLLYTNNRGMCQACHQW